MQSRSTGERLAEELNEGDFAVVTVGELVYRKRETKEGEESRLEILVWRVQKGESAAASDPIAADAISEPSAEPSAKKGKPRYPKWKPEPVESSN